MSNSDQQAPGGVPPNSLPPPANDPLSTGGQSLLAPSALITSGPVGNSTNTGALLSHGLSNEQINQIKDLINNHLNKIVEAKISVVFPTKRTYAVFTVLAIVILAGLYLIYQIPDVVLSNDEAKMKYQFAQYVARHLTIGLVILSIVISIYKFLFYTAKQYYLFNKYQILTTNRIAILSTVMLTGGKVDPQAYIHFVADISEPNDAHETQTLHEKFMEHVFGLLKDVLPSTKGLKELLEKKS